VPRFVLVALFSGLLWSQSSTTGNLQGIVVDSTGSPMAGASVTLRSLFQALRALCNLRRTALQRLQFAYRQLLLARGTAEF
jgi:hypothetical protein